MQYKDGTMKNPTTAHGLQRAHVPFYHSENLCELSCSTERILPMKNADFERCADFLARMIEKYGGELDLSKTGDEDNAAVEGEKKPFTAGEM